MKKIILFLLLLTSVQAVRAVDEITPAEGWAAIGRYRQGDQRDSLALIHARLAEYYASRQVDSCFYHCQQGLELADTECEHPYIDLLLTQAHYYNAIGSSRECADINLQALREAERLHGGDYTVGNILSSLGVSYRRLNMPDSALICYNRSLECLERAGEEAREDIPFLLTSISILYANTARLEEAEHYIRQAIDRAEGCEDLDMHLYISNTAGAIYTLLKQYGEAREVMLQSLDKARKADKPRYVLQCLSPLLTLFKQTGNFRAVDRYVREAEPWLERLPPVSNEVLGFKETLAIIYTAQGRYAESNACYDEVLDHYAQNSPGYLQGIYAGKARNYVGLRQLQSASDCYERVVTLMDSVHQSEITQQLSEFSVKYDTQEKELEILRLREERLLQQNRLMLWGMISGVLLVLCLAVIFVLLLRKRRLQQQAELQAARSFIDGLEQERTRIAKELHDGICNDLLGVGLLLQLDETKSGDRRDILRCLETIRADVRYISHELTPPQFSQVTLDEVLEERFRQLFASGEPQLTFRKQGGAALWKQLPEKVAYEVYRIVQELTGNIIRHAEATRIDVSLTVKPGYLEIRIDNDGKAYDPHQTARNGIGQNTVRERVKSLGAHLETDFVDGTQQLVLEVSWS